MLSTPKAKAELFLASSLYDGLEDNNIMQVTTLLLNKEADPNVLIPSQGITPFHLVIGNDSETFAEEVTKLFLRHGGNPNVKSVDGMTPVHVAAAWGRLGVLELLLSNGGDPLLVDDDGRSPFHYAFDEAHYDAVATLGKYCGEPFEEDSDLKYNIALDKILVSNGGIVAEYAVSEDQISISAGDISTSCTSESSNNNDDLRKNLNQQLVPPLKAENYFREWYPKFPADNDLKITTTADETTVSLSKFVNVRRRRRYLPREIIKDVECKLGNEDSMDQAVRAERDLPNENLCARSTDTENWPSISHLNDSTIEASFHVEAKKIGENMPRISSPKAKTHLSKSEHDALTKNRNIGMAILRNINDKNKLAHKIPLRACSKREPLSLTKKTPISAKKGYNLNSRITPHCGKFQIKNDNRTLIRTPTKYPLTKISYSPDCSIVSKSPNLMRTPKTPTNNYKMREESKIPVRNRGTQSVKSLKRISPHGTGHVTPTIYNICKKGNSGKTVSRFVKQSELRHESMKKMPISNPSKFHHSPTWSKKSKCTPNITDSTKRIKTIPTSETKTVKPSYSPRCILPTALDKTYTKNRNIEAADFSPDVETANRFFDRRTLDKKVAIKLEETMYDDHCEKCILSTKSEEIKKIHPIIGPVKGIVSDTDGSGCLVAKKCELLTADNRLNRSKKKMNSDGLTSNKYVEISGIHKLADSIQVVSERQARSSNDSSLSHKYARRSTVVAGYFQSSDISSSSVSRSNVNSMMNNAIAAAVSSPYSNVLASNILRIENRHPNTKEIDDSLISSDRSNYSLGNHAREPINSLNFDNTDLSIESKELLRNGLTHGIDVSESEYGLRRFADESYPMNNLENSCLYPTVSSNVDSSNYMSFVSLEEEYKYEDAEEGIILLERRLLITPISIPMIKFEDDIAPSEKSSKGVDGDSIRSCASTLPHSLLVMDSDTLRKELTRLEYRPPGPITATTRHVYLKRLRKLQKHGPTKSTLTAAVPSKFSVEIERTLRSGSWMNDLSSYEALERQVFSEFANPDPTRRWREGTTKSSFNYLLMDPRVTDNLPRRADMLSPVECWRTFLSSVFYIGKGRRSRPYAHLYVAYSEWKKGVKDTSDKKVNHIMDIWESNCGVVCLHLFQNTIPAEAYTREAAMIEALGLDRLKNLKVGDYYGVASTWSHHQKRTLGVYLLYKAMHILINEGERQLSPDDIGR